MKAFASATIQNGLFVMRDVQISMWMRKTAAIVEMPAMQEYLAVAESVVLKNDARIS